MAKGNISVDSENLFPIIKKWLYSDKDIFLRELVSNGCDAVTKLKKLASIGEAQIDENEKFKVTVSIFKDAKKLVISDNGIGMTAEEIDKYINQIAFSGASDFLSKYKEEDDKGSQIIGHFGLGFYSAFMVADSVEIDSLSYQDGAKAAKWICDGSMEFDLTDGDRTERGTTITLNIAEDSEEFLEESTIRQILHKYCAFLPIEIYVEVPEDKHEDHCDCGHDHDHEHEDDTPSEPKPINNTTPLWMKKPSECTDEEYKEFYRNVFMDFNEPLFWIHLNVDYPFNLKGILYFPRINTEYDSIEGTIKLYNNQVFIADNIKEVIPEFLMVLKGVIDCPDLPLNVSRSALQNDGFVGKIAEYISKKVADKLAGMCKTKREDYEKYWDSISPFIKFGCLKDEKFCDKMKDAVLFKNIDGKYLTLKDCVEANGGELKELDKNAAPDNAEENAEEKKTTIYYVTDEIQQSQYINMFRKEGLDAVYMGHSIDSPFIGQLAQKHEGLKFLRIDADVTDALKSKTSKKAEKEMEEQAESISKLMKKALKNDKITIKVEKLKNKKISSMITLSEESRRMQDMMKMYSMPGMDMSAFGGEGETLILNANHPLVQYITEHQDGENAEMICEQLYDLAMLSHKQLSPDESYPVMERMHYSTMIVNAQTGEFMNPVKLKDRLLDAPKVTSWKDVR